MQQLMFQGDQQFGFDTLRNLGLVVYGGSDIGEVVETAFRSPPATTTAGTTPGCGR
ncbi:hypothetical protein [Kitasatospora sp. NBC_01300]|uniref:hypothetical protein n=1 Tax=Kitasatospora sp. NBC_01300 TaxID=2903574 RepID=UPI002F91022D|nr:hypothetical protein OG556_39640 [Kitasatospora sp. NBC_01300]